MIEYVEEHTSTYAPIPERLEAGTQNVEGVLGLTEAIRHIMTIGLEVIKSSEQKITAYAYNALKKLDYIDIYGPRNLRDRGALICFNVRDVHPHDVASIMDFHNVAIRAGHHCCQPLMHYMKTHATCRVSFAYYNTESDVDQFIKALEEVKAVFYE
jgi:cysteine desulfurase/selenocysteine lyase